MKLFSTLFIALLISVSYPLFAQTDSTFIGHAISALDKNTAEKPVEKVYLHLDKPNYMPGDTIWFKAYTVVGGQHQLSGLSGILYAELISEKDSVVKRLNLQLTSGAAWGDIALSRDIKQGSYHLRAYTNWMRNAGTEYFYNQAIRIGSALPPVKPANAATSNPDVQFFPEGGTLVNGIRSKVAVKSVGANGLGVDIKGTITDNDGNEVAEFSTQHLGMGIFALTPTEGKTYKAKITLAGGGSFTVDLPKAMEEGFTLGLNNSQPDSILIKVAVNSKLFATQQNSTFYLVAQSQGKVYFASQGKLSGPVFVSKVDKKRFPTGIAQFTLFSQSGEPMNERIAFIRNNDTLTLKATTSAEKYTPRQKVKIDLTAATEDKQPAIGTFSVAVINESSLMFDKDAEGTILNNLLLTSDLKGYIEKPNYYFGSDPQANAHLDILMLTQGYRRFEWAQVLSDKKPLKAYQPEKTLEIAGSIKTPSGKPVPNGKIMLMATRENFITDTVADINGNFKFTNIDLSDTSKILLRARKESNGGNVTIYLQQKDFPGIRKQPVSIEADTIALTPEMQKNIKEYRTMLKQDSLKNGIKLNEVVIKAQKRPKPDEYNHYGTAPEHELDMKILNKYYSLDQGLGYATTAVTVGPGKISHKPRIVIVDGVVSDIDLKIFSPSEIESVRVVYGLKKEPGYLVVTTKHYAGTDTTRLKEVKVVSKKDPFKKDLSHSSNLSGPGHADQVIMGDAVSNCIKLSDCLNGKVMGVTFRNGAAYNNRANNRISGNTPMAVIVDGAQLDGSALDDINASDVYSIEVLRSGANMAIYGSNLSGSGALVITTRRGGDANYVTSEKPRGLITYPFKGFYKARAFYLPKYAGPKTPAQELDLRSTVYWNPNLITGKDGKSSIEYFTGDTRGTFRVVVEGIDDDGNLGRQVFRYKVE